ncbi:MAG: cation:proton antiporter [Acidobacteriota bacterium]
MILTTVVAAVVLGIAAQMAAERLKLPAILPLLLFGILAGPELWPLFGMDLPGLIQPHALGEGLEVLIHLGIALILFEGGLSLDPRHLRRVGAAVRNLLTFGMALTAVGGAVLFRVVTEMPWSTAALFGAIVTVTGPTVVTPLLRHMVVPRRVSTVLISEGLIIDPLGAVLAYLVLQTIERPGIPLEGLLGEVVWLAFIGSVFGFAAGSAAKIVVRSRFAGGELRNLCILAILLLAYAVSESQAPESGILAAVVMGFTMSALDIPDLVRLKAFKGQLTVLLISVLFILLAGQLDVEAVLALGWRGVLVVAGLVLLVRPLSVFFSVPPRQLDLKARTVVALTAPRGIVAAAVASLSARALTESGIAGGPSLEGMVYLTIILTGIWASVMAVTLPRALGYADDPRRRLTVVVGANALAAEVARLFRARGVTVGVVDASASKLDPLRREGFETVRGDARDAVTFEQAGVQRDTRVLALTTNDELNLLVAELLRDEFGIEHPVVALHRPSEEFGKVRRAWMDLLGGRGLDLSHWIRRLEAGRARLVTVDLGREGERQGALDGVRILTGAERAPAVPLVGWKEGSPTFRLADEELESLACLTLLVEAAEVPEEVRPFVIEPADLGEGDGTTEEDGSGEDGPEGEEAS